MGTLDQQPVTDPEMEQDASEPVDDDHPQPGQSRFRYRITYSKDGPLRYTSQLDLARIWERSLRRAGLALLYSQGFNPRPKIQLAVGLPLGYSSRCEIVDAWLVSPIADEQAAVEELNAASPAGLVIDDLHAVDVHEPALQGLVWSTTYEVRFREPIEPADLARRVADLLAQPELWRERREKQVNLRPLIDHLRLLDEPQAALEMSLAASPTRGTARPDEVLDMLDIDPASAMVVRTAINFQPGTPSG